MKKTHKLLFVFLTVFSLISAVAYIYRVEILAFIGVKPNVVMEYVCSDLCNESDYKSVYEGIEDLEYCKKIGGTPYEYYGWGEFQACLAE